MTSVSKEPIEGVVTTPLKVVRNERGGLMEVQRRDDPSHPGFGQVYVTQTCEGLVKAWYRHRRQTDQLAAITGSIKLALFDDREHSPTRGGVNEIIMGEEAPRLVLIPPGVWHGFKAISNGGAFLLHLNSEPFAHDAPDEDRLDPNDPSIPYRW